MYCKGIRVKIKHTNIQIRTEIDDVAGCDEMVERVLLLVLQLVQKVALHGLNLYCGVQSDVNGGRRKIDRNSTVQAAVHFPTLLAHLQTTEQDAVE